MGKDIAHRPAETTHQRRLEIRNNKRRTDDRKLLKIPRAPLPIAIVRQGQSFVEFTVQNTTWFAAEASSAGLNVDDNLSPVHIFTVFPLDNFGSEHCVMSENLSPIDVASNIIMRAYCSNAGSFAVAQAYVRFGNSDHTTSNAEIPKCCHDPYVDSSLASSSKVIKYEFKLKCSPSCDNTKAHADNRTNESETTAIIAPLSGSMRKPSRTAPSSEPTDSPNAKPIANTTVNAMTDLSTATKSPSDTITNQTVLTPELHERHKKHRSGGGFTLGFLFGGVVGGATTLLVGVIIAMCRSPAFSKPPVDTRLLPYYT